MNNYVDVLHTLCLTVTDNYILTEWESQMLFCGQRDIMEQDDFEVKHTCFVKILFCENISSQPPNTWLFIHQIVLNMYENLK